MIEEDGLLPKCGLCGMRTQNITQHQQLTTCRAARRRRENEQKLVKQVEGNNVIFTVNGKPLERVRHFKYLGRILSDNDDDSICINENLKRARKRWNCIARILKVEGANAKCMSKFYLTVVQAVLLYGADTWVIKKQDMDRLRSFHWRAIRYMTGKNVRGAK